MPIVTIRRITQGFFLVLFVWFCLVATLGEAWWQLRGWPVNWFLELDPLTGLSTLLSTGTVYRGLLWGLLTVVMTLFLGRFFCGWICPFGTLHQTLGYLSMRTKPLAQRVRVNRYHPAQTVKYWILTVLLAAAGGELLRSLALVPRLTPAGPAAVGIALVLLGVVLTVYARRSLVKTAVGLAAAAVVWALFARNYSGGLLPSAALQIGLLDPIALLQRSVNLIVLPLVDGSVARLWASPRRYDGSVLMATVFVAALMLNFYRPRFYCRFICPLGALLAVLGRHAPWRMGRTEVACSQCLGCEAHCEGACQPAARIRGAECVLCLNCRPACEHGLMVFRGKASPAGEHAAPDVTRRALLLSMTAGLAMAPVMRLNGSTGTHWNPDLIRPPGALGEAAFLARCIKCGQCMRICPTNVIQPAGLAHGLEALWTPTLNFRIGTSGCQHNCIACGHVCPTGAIQGLRLEQRLGRGSYGTRGPLRIGTAFVDRGRCLPWAMGTPCIVCQENCPVSPKAITTREVYAALHTSAALTIRAVSGKQVQVAGPLPEPELDQWAGGDHFIHVGGRHVPVTANDADAVSLAEDVSERLRQGDRLEIVIRLQQPYVEPRRCIGCGVCEHECPVKGRRAIRVTAENASRDRAYQLML